MFKLEKKTFCFGQQIETFLFLGFSFSLSITTGILTENATDIVFSLIIQFYIHISIPLNIKKGNEIHVYLYKAKIFVHKYG